MKKVLITGGAGFIGSNLCRCLLNKGDYEITVLDNFITGREDNLNNMDINVVKEDVTNKEVVNKLTKGKDIIFHLSCSNIYVSGEYPYKDIETNIMGTYSVFESALRNDVSRIVYSSTSSVYGNSQTLPIFEDDQKQFLNNYSVSKYAGEAYAQRFWLTQKLPITTIRYSNVFGYNQYPDNPYSGVIGKFIGSAIDSENIYIHGDGNQTRDYTFIDDACEYTYLASIEKSAIGKCFNIGSGIESSVNKIANIIINETNSKSVIKYIKNRDIDNVKRRFLSIDHIIKSLSYKPQTSLIEGIRKTIKWRKSKLIK